MSGEAAAAPTPASIRRARRRRKLRFVAAVVGLVIALVTAELVLRLLNVTAEPKRHFSPGIYAADDEITWGLQANYTGTYRNQSEHTPTRTNAKGFRGSEWEPDTQRALRVLALGDSCTFGMGVADDATYPVLLQDELRAAKQDAAVFNLGVMGYDTHKELRVLERHGEALAPHVVVLGWLPNDATLADQADGVFVREGHLVEDEEEFEEWRARSERRGINGSLLYRVLRVRSKHLKTALGLKRSNWTPENYTQQALAPSMESLSKIHAHCQALGARLIVVLFPRREEIEDTLSLEHYSLVRAHAKELGVQVIDLPTAWRETPPPGEGPLFLFRDNVHPTRRGYADLARRLRAAILNETH